MICRSCKSTTNRIKVIDGVDYCNNCTDMTETGGAKVDGSITRNSFRVRDQQRHYQSDMTPPYVYDKSKRRGVVNPDFVKLFPKEAEKTFTSQELKSAGISRLKGKD